MNRPRIIISLNSKREFSELGSQLRHSFGFDVSFMESEMEILDNIHKESVDFLIVDLEMKNTDGISFCREVKAISGNNSPFVLIVSHRAEDYIQAAAFDSGADGFILKPLKARIVAARLNAMLKRKKGQVEIRSNVFEKLVIDSDRHLVIINSKEIYLPKKEFNLLKLLYSNPHKIFTRSEIAKQIWQDANVGSKENRTIDVHMSNLRNKIGENYVRTISGVGYIFNLPQQ